MKNVIKQKTNHCSKSLLNFTSNILNEISIDKDEMN
jgi:hypothetical protein